MSWLVPEPEEANEGGLLSALRGPVFTGGTTVPLCRPAVTSSGSWPWALPLGQPCSGTLEHGAAALIPREAPSTLLQSPVSPGFVSSLGSVAGAARLSPQHQLLMIPGQDRGAPKLHAEPRAGALEMSLQAALACTGRGAGWPWSLQDECLSSNPYFTLLLAQKSLVLPSFPLQ